MIFRLAKGFRVGLAELQLVAHDYSLTLDASLLVAFPAWPLLISVKNFCHVERVKDTMQALSVTNRYQLIQQTLEKC
jgi:hypothetical protein